jgi:hypothetical protein
MRNALPTGTSNGASPSKGDEVPVTYAPHAHDVPVVALTESIARLIAELAETRVVSDQRAAQLVTQAETIGQLRERLALAESRLSALEAPQHAPESPVGAPTAAETPDPIPDPDPTRSPSHWRPRPTGRPGGGGGWWRSTGEGRLTLELLIMLSGALAGVILVLFVVASRRG